MRVRASTSLDKEISNEWRVAHGAPTVCPEALPDTGVVCERLSDSRPLAMAWLYLTNSKMAYVAWPVTNPITRPREAKEALTLAITELMGLADSLGMHYLISTSASRGLSKLLVQCGFKMQKKTHDLLIREVV